MRERHQCSADKAFLQQSQTNRRNNPTRPMRPLDVRCRWSRRRVIRMFSKNLWALPSDLHNVYYTGHIGKYLWRRLVYVTKWKYPRRCLERTSLQVRTGPEQQRVTDSRTKRANQNQEDALQFGHNMPSNNGQNVNRFSESPRTNLRRM